MAHVPSVDLAVYFASQTGYVRGRELFTGRMPDSPSEAIAFSDTGGVAPMNVFDGKASRQPTLQVMVRAKALDYIGARILIDTVFDVLHCKTNITANGLLYKSVNAMQEPIWLGYDDSERPQWSLNFSLMF